MPTIMGVVSRLSLLACGIPAVLAGTVPSISGYTLTWSDDFEGDAGAAPSSANWIIDTGTSYSGGPANWGTGEVETYTNSVNNVELTGDGQLAITPTKSSSGQWSSARIETVDTSFGASSGKKMIIQASIQMPAVTGAAAAGYWPAFWALGAAYRGNYNDWPDIGEFDIMENVNGQDWASGTLHCGSASGGPCDETDGLGAQIACPDSACQGNYHTYTIELDRSISPETLTWSVDGEVYHTVTSTDVGDASAWSDAVDDTKFIILNVAMGGGYPNGVYGSTTPTSSTEPGYSMLVEYVAVYNA